MPLQSLPEDVQRYLRSLVYAYQLHPTYNTDLQRVFQALVHFECQRYRVQVREIADRVEQGAMVENGQWVSA